MKYVLALLLLVGCTHARNFHVTSSNPASIDVNGMTECNSTPCIVKVECDADFRRWVQVVATPKVKGDYPQQKTIECQNLKYGADTVRNISFEMGLRQH
jgi:hypothetical protein